MMNEESFRTEVNEIIKLLKTHHVESVKLMYGWSWGEWEWVSPVLVDDIMSEIRQQEIQTRAHFGHNDVYVNIPQYGMELLFCHEADLHLDFNGSNPLALDILNSWIDKDIVHAVKSGQRDMNLDELMASL